MISNETISNFLSIAKEAVLKTGNALSGARQEYLKTDSESRRDIKLRADTESENIILEHLKNNSD